MSLIIVGIDNSSKKKYYTVNTVDGNLYIYTMQELIAAFNESDKNGNFRISKNGSKIVKKGPNRLGLNVCRLENGNITSGGILTLIDTKIGQDEEIIHRVYDVSYRTYSEISNDTLVELINENKVNNDEWRKVNESDRYKEYILLLKFEGNKEKVESCIHMRVYSDNTLKAFDASNTDITEHLDEQLDEQLDKQADMSSVETLEKLLQSDETDKPSSERVTNNYLINNESNDTSDNTNELDFEYYKKVIYNMYPNDRITISYDMLARLDFRILRVIDSNIDGTEKITIGRIDKAQIKSMFILAKLDDNKQICTLQIIGHTDIPEKAMDGDIEKFCITYNKWLQMTRYF